MKPCDCRDQQDADKLKEQGISFNENSILIDPCMVILSRGHCSMRITQHAFEEFARWYLDDQN